MRIVIFLLFAFFYLLTGCTNSQGIPEDKAPLAKGYEAKLILQEDFEKLSPGKLPQGWFSTYTGNGHFGVWQVVDDNGNKVLAQLSSKNRGYHFNLAISEKPVLKDVEIKLRFKGVKGVEDQGGGPVWRFRDKNNYYVARANPLENNFRVYKVVNGRRIQLASARVPVPTGKWHTIKIRMVGTHIECFYNGKKYLDVKDSTFDAPGKIGLWSKADAVTYFDDLEVYEIVKSK